jgi:transposase
VSRYDLTDFEWRVIAPLLRNKPRGVPRVDDRRVLNGIFFGCRDPARLGVICQSGLARALPA